VPLILYVVSETGTDKELVAKPFHTQSATTISQRSASVITSVRRDSTWSGPNNRSYTAPHSLRRQQALSLLEASSRART